MAILRELSVFVRFASVCRSVGAEGFDPRSFRFDRVRLRSMSSVREYVVEDPELGPRRAYLSSTVANMANVTAKTVTTWVSSDAAAPPAPLRGWAPRSDCNPSGRWLIDATMADEAWGRTTQVGAPRDSDLDGERQRLADERAMFELERRVGNVEMIAQIELDVIGNIIESVESIVFPLKRPILRNINLSHR